MQLYLGMRKHPLLVIVVMINGGCFIVKLLGRR